MQTAFSLLISLFFAALLIRALVTPVKLAVKLALQAACGFACLWILNTTAGFTGVYLPVNAVTVLIAGTLGLPGIGVITLLEMM
jgi:inhibitor of the pro-sigma K processing machinery